MASSSSSSSGIGLLDNKLPMRDLTGKYARFRNEFFLSASHTHIRSSPQPSSHASLSGPLLASSDSSALDLEDQGPGLTLRPEWADIHDQVEADMRSIKELLSALKTLHRERCGVNFDEDAVKKQEAEIEILTQNITTKLRKCETGIKRIALVGDVGSLSQKERNVRLNSMRMLAQDLSAHSKAFRYAQKDFLKAITDQAKGDGRFGFDNQDRGAIASALDESHLDETLSLEQQQQLDEINTRASEREREIIRIAKSVHDLATLFSELNVLVIEQGTVLDRIDYNLEQTQNSVSKGVNELTEAEKISRRALTCKCIVVLLIVVVILIAILIYKHRK